MYQSVQAASSWGLRLQCGEGLDILRPTLGEKVRNDNKDFATKASPS